VADPTLPTLAGVGVLVVCCLIAIEFGGKSKSAFLAGICVLAFLPFYRNHTLFQPVAFEQFFWTLGFYFLVKYFNSKQDKFLLFFGIVAGLAILNKYTSLVWVFSVVIGLLFYEKAKLFKNRMLYISGIIAFMMVLPNLIWQYQHEFPLLLHLKALKESQLDQISPFEFATDQLEYPFTLALSLIGLYVFFFDSDFKKYRSLVISVILFFVILWLQQAMSYYFFGIYPILFAAGAVKIEKMLIRKPVFAYLIAAIIFIPSITYIPYLSPILPIESFVKYSDKKEENGRVKLTNDYADMFGWEEQVRLVDSVFKSIPKESRSKTLVFTSNYGEAGAVRILGKKYGLPEPVCVSGSHWLWGYGNPDPELFIMIGHDEETIKNFFGEAKMIKVIKHKYAIEEENNITLYLCSKPKFNIAEKWPEFKKYIFN